MSRKSTQTQVQLRSRGLKGRGLKRLISLMAGFVFLLTAIIPNSLPALALSPGQVPTPPIKAGDRVLPANQPDKGLIYTGLSVNETRCPGSYAVENSNLCTHGPDTVMPGLDISRDAVPLTPEQLAPFAVACDGDGTSGKRVQVVYARAADKVDRFNAFVNSIRTWASDADDIFQASAQETGGHRHLRFVTNTDCSINVRNVVLPNDGDDDFSKTQARMAALGFNSAFRKYMIFMDANVYCGIGNIENDSSSGLGNRNNSVVSYGRSDAGCWDGGTAAHELMHNLGGVQLNAPHTSGGWHCTDEWDLECYSDSPNYPAMVIRCPDGAHNLRFDCNHDDYYSTNPPAGSYLATHWNTANSDWLIKSPLDTDGGVLTIGSNRDGTINPSGDNDDYTFFAAPNTKVLITMDKTSGSGLDSYLELYRTISIFFIDIDVLVVSNDDGGGNRNARILTTLPGSEGNRYRIRARGYGSSVGGYNIALANGNGDSDDGRFLGTSTLVDGTIDPLADQDTYYISASAGRIMSFRMNQAAGSGVDPYLQLYSPSGVLLKSNDDGGGGASGRDAWLVWQTTTTGVYRLVARAYNNVSVGAYQLRSQFVVNANYAAGRIATASSTETIGYEPWRSNDTNVGSRWSSRFSDYQWLQIDMGLNRSFNQVIINWEVAYGRRYNVYVWTGLFWRRLYTTSTGDGGIDVVTFPLTTGRYVLLEGTQRGTPWGYSVWELGIYDNTSTPLPTVLAEDPAKVVDNVGQTTTLPPADEGKEITLSGDGEAGQENEPLALSPGDPGFEVITPTLDTVTATLPVATIIYASSGFSDTTPATELSLLGLASAISGTNVVEYEWKSSLNGVIATQISATLPISALNPGTHILTFRVKDDQGNWSLADQTNWQKITSNLYMPVLIK